MYHFHFIGYLQISSPCFKKHIFVNMWNDCDLFSERFNCTYEHCWGYFLCTHFYVHFYFWINFENLKESYRDNTESSHSGENVSKLVEAMIAKHLSMHWMLPQGDYGFYIFGFIYLFCIDCLTKIIFSPKSFLL